MVYQIKLKFFPDCCQSCPEKQFLKNLDHTLHSHSFLYCLHVFSHWVCLFLFGGRVGEGEVQLVISCSLSFYLTIATLRIRWQAAGWRELIVNAWERGGIKVCTQEETRGSGSNQEATMEWRGAVSTDNIPNGWTKIGPLADAIFRTLPSRSWRGDFYKFDPSLSWNSDFELRIHFFIL